MGKWRGTGAHGLPAGMEGGVLIIDDGFSVESTALLL